MAVSSTESGPTPREVWRLAWPIVLANSAVPLLGLVDTAVIGHTGTVQGLGAIALGAIVFNFAYWSFGFLRMGTTGFTAQASGARDEPEVRATLGRALLLSAGLGVLLVVLQAPIGWVALQLLGASVEVETLTRTYFDIRIWGAPATLGTYAILGSLVGLGRTRQLLQIQVVLNGLNITLDVLFGAVLDWGVAGIALGTAISEWTTFGLALVIVSRILRGRHRDDEGFWPWPRILDRVKAVQTMSANADIMVRTWFLLLGFAWFTNQGALFGDTILAANHVLLQLVSTSAHLLDGYAHATEVLVGRAVGARSIRAFDRAVKAASGLAGMSAIGLTVVIVLLGEPTVALLTDLEAVRTTAVSFLPYASLYVLLSFAAFQLDGVFIGATRTRAMRNASVLSCLFFLGCTWVLVPRWDNVGLWVAFILYVLARAVSLGVWVPPLRRAIGMQGLAGGVGAVADADREADGHAPGQDA